MRSLAALAATHLAGNALLLWLGYYWLGLGESRAGALVWSALVAVVLVSLGCWLYGATLAYFAANRYALIAAFRTSLRRLALLVAVAVAVIAIYLLLARAAEWSAQPAFKIASWLTLTFRKPVKPKTVQAVFNVAIWLIRWMVAPVLLLPVISKIAAGAAVRAHAARLLYWVEAPVLLLCALWAPLKLLGWTPHAAGFGLEMFSFILRALAAYLLFAGAWLVLAFLTSGGKPRDIQPSTVVSP